MDGEWFRFLYRAVLDCFFVDVEGGGGGGGDGRRVGVREIRMCVR